jgi:spore coat protein U-like protein
MRTRFNRVGVAVIMAFSFTNSIIAGTATSNLTVSATVVSGCQISSVGNIGFGNYDPLSSTPNDAAGNIVFRCVKGTSYKTYITGTRIMTGGGNTLDFQLYSDSTRTTAFPDSNSSSSVTAPGNSPITNNIYGRISPQQDVAPASYNATLVATVEY